MASQRDWTTTRWLSVLWVWFTWVSFVISGHIGQTDKILFSSVQFSSVAQSCLTLCDPMNRSMPGLPVHHQLPEFTTRHIKSERTWSLRLPHKAKFEPPATCHFAGCPDAGPPWWHIWTPRHRWFKTTKCGLFTATQSRGWGGRGQPCCFW